MQQQKGKNSQIQMLQLHTLTCPATAHKTNNVPKILFTIRICIDVSTHQEGYSIIIIQ